MSNAEYFVFDVESGGIDVFNDRVVQFFGATADKDGNLIDTWEIFINPGVDIAQEAVDVHGFSNELLKDIGEYPQEAFGKIKQLFLEHRNLKVVAFNMNYDLSILDAEMKRHGVSQTFGKWFAESGKLIDGLVIDRHKDKYRKGKRNLETQAKHYGVEFDPDALHDAGADAELTAKVTVAILNKYGTPSTSEQGMWYTEWAQGFEDFKKRSDPTFRMDSKEWPLRTE